MTEVPTVKLFAALERGETLTSMYVRVNDTAVSREAEADLKEMDVLEDPLIRTLFTGLFGAYQREQLRRIKSSAANLALSSHKLAELGPGGIPAEPFANHS